MITLLLACVVQERKCQIGNGCDKSDQNGVEGQPEARDGGEVAEGKDAKWADGG